MDKPDWLDEERRKVDVTICWIISPDCDCEWQTQDGPDVPEYVLSKRNRECVLHGEHGVF